MQYKLEKISPAKAQIMLKKNPNNRTLKHKHVEFLAAQMIQGNWQDNGQTIIIDANDNLLDGQHRLNAIVQAERTIPMLVVRGVSPKTMNTIDTGASRNAGDTFEMNGVLNAGAVSSMARTLMLWDKENMHSSMDHSGWGNDKPSNDEIFKYHNKRKKDYQWAFSQTYRKTLGGATVTQAGTAVMILSRNHPMAKIEEFVEKVKNGGDYSKSPTHFLPKWIQQRRDGEWKTYRNEQVFAILYCFEKWLAGDTMSGMRIHKVFDNCEHYYSSYNKKRAVTLDQEELELV